MNKTRLLILLFCLVIGLNLAIFISSSGTSNTNQQLGLPSNIDEEPILSFDTEIRITTEDSLSVAEQIQVKGAGKNFKRGIIRPLPSRVADSKKGFLTPQYKIISVLRNGQMITIPAAKASNTDYLYYLGEVDKFLSPGIYNYFFQYSAEGIIEKLPTIKRLTFDVTGAAALPIYQSSVVVRLSDQLKEENVTYRGFIVQPLKPGDDEKTIPERSEADVSKKFEIDDGSLDPGAKGRPRIKFSTTRTLKPLERFVIEISWAI